MKKYVLAAVTVLLMFTANAQWLQQNAGFTNDTLGFYEMSLPDKNTAWAVCYDGKGGLLSGRPVLDFTRTTTEGNTWIPGKVGSDRTLRFSNISAIDGQEAWVAMHKIGPVPNNLFLSFGRGGGVFHTTDAGVNWEQSNPVSFSTTTQFPGLYILRIRTMVLPWEILMVDILKCISLIIKAKNGKGCVRTISLHHLKTKLAG